MAKVVGMTIIAVVKVVVVVRVVVMVKITVMMTIVALEILTAITTVVKVVNNNCNRSNGNEVVAIKDMGFSFLKIVKIKPIASNLFFTKVSVILFLKF